jgi:hypothetical protein
MYIMGLSISTHTFAISTRSFAIPTQSFARATQDPDFEKFYCLRTVAHPGP